MADVNAILNERGKTHGAYEDHAYYTQRIKSVLRESKNWYILSDAQKESLEMNAHKIGRILAGNPNVPDHWDDMAGYSTLASKDIVAGAARVKEAYGCKTGPGGSIHDYSDTVVKADGTYVTNIRHPIPDAIQAIKSYFPVNFYDGESRD